MEETFTSVYENSVWGNNMSDEYKGSSGPGSTISFNIDTYIPFLKTFITDNNIKTVVDLGCGDFICGNLIYDDLDIQYTGYDGYKKIVDYHASINPIPKFTFIHLDFCFNKQDIVGGDLCILKDVIQHWSLENIYSFFDYVIENKKFKYILICNCCHQTCDNSDISNGDFRHLSSDFLPLKKYNAVKKYNYHSKEVSIIEIN
jgi:hypothetical protein